MEKGQKLGRVRFTDEERVAFYRLKNAFREVPILRHFDLEKPVILETDALEFAIGAVLS